MVSPLINEENLLMSSTGGGFMFKDTALDNDSEENYTPACVYLAIYNLFLNLVEKSTGQIPNDAELPDDLVSLLSYLANSAGVDKRLITNHSVMMTPENRIHLIRRIDFVLRQEVPFFYDKEMDLRGQHILEELAVLKPAGMSSFEGIHPFFDRWLSHSKTLREKLAAAEGVNMSSSGSTSLFASKDAMLGRTLVALERDAVTHPFGPGYAQVAPMFGVRYSLEVVEELLHQKIPMYGPKAQLSFMNRKIWNGIAVNKFYRRTHSNWTDVRGDLPTWI